MDFNPEDKTVVGLTLGQKVFDRYELDRVLGQGAMGVVWLAQDTVMGEPVALKFLPQILAADPAALEEMKDEARHARRLSHENIVRIHDMVTGGNLAAISMEYVDGTTLSGLRLKKPNRVLEVEDLEPLLPQIAAGLDYAHQRAKVVHRDLKPSNLMVTQKGDLKITDFGIARSLTDTVTRLTKASTSGTPCYMSPQQMMGKRPDPKDDLYALGAMLYELLTGKPPFYTGDLGMQVLHAEVVPVRERREEFGIAGGAIPEAWEEMLLRCLSKDPEQRPSSAGELVAALRLEGMESTPPPLDPALFEQSEDSVAGIEALESMTQLARNGEWDRLKREQEALSKSALGEEEKARLLEKVNDAVWNTVLERAQAKLKGGEAAEAYQILSAFEASGLGDERFASLKPRMEAIRAEANKPVLKELAELGGNVSDSETAREEALQRLEASRGRYLPGPEGAEAFHARVDALKEKWSPTPVEPEGPPPLPKIPVRKQAEPEVRPEAQPERVSVGGGASPRKPVAKKKTSTGLILGLVVPLLAAVCFFVFYLPYGGGKKDLEEIDTLVGEGYLDLAENELDRLSGNFLKSLFLKSEVQARRELFKTDQELVALYADYPGLKPAYGELRKRYPNAKIVEAPLSWEQFPEFIRGLPPGTVLLLTEPEYVVSQPLQLEQAIGVVGAQGRSVLRVEDPEALPVFATSGQDLLLAGLDLVATVKGSSAGEPLAIVEGGDFRFHALLVKGAGEGISLRGARGKMDDSTIRNSAGTGVRISGPGTEVQLSRTTWTDCEIGLLVAEGAVLQLEDGVFSGSGTVGIQVLDPKTEFTALRTAVNGGNRGLSVADGALAKVEASLFYSNRNAGITVSGVGSKLIFRGSESNQNGVGVEVLSGGRVQAFEMRAEANGGHGLWVTGMDSFIEVDEGEFSENAANGASVTDRGTLVLKGVDSRMNESGVVARGRGTRLGLSNCVINENRADGVIVFEGARARVRDTHVLDNAMNGMKVFNPGSEVEVTSSYFEGNGEDGILAFMGAAGRFRDNQVLGNADSGFSISETGTTVELYENEARENGKHGVYIGAGAEGWIESTIASGNADAGILVGSPDTFARVIANDVSENAFGIVVQTQATGEVLENRSYRNENSGLGIFSAGSTALVSNNELRDNGTFGLDMNPDSRVTVLQDNTYAGNASGPRK